MVACVVEKTSFLEDRVQMVVSIYKVALILELSATHFIPQHILLSADQKQSYLSLQHHRLTMASIPASGQSYYILALDRPLTLDLAGGNPANGTPCLGWTPHFDQQARNRIWTFTEAGLGYWFIQNAATGTALTLAAGSPEGSPVVCSSASTGDADRWRIAILPPTPGQVTTWM